MVNDLEIVNLNLLIYTSNGIVVISVCLKIRLGAAREGVAPACRAIGSGLSGLSGVTSEKGLF